MVFGAIEYRPTRATLHNKSGLNLDLPMGSIQAGVLGKVRQGRGGLRATLAVAAGTASLLLVTRQPLLLVPELAAHECSNGEPLPIHPKSY